MAKALSRLALPALLVVSSLYAVAIAQQSGDWASAYNRGDYTTAAQLIRPVAEDGDAGAQYWLGIMCESGKGVPQDYAEALKWYQKSADQSNAWAMKALGIAYLFGKTAPQDYVQAHKWLNLAVSRFSASESAASEQAAKLRDLVAGMMTPAQIAEAQKLAREWQPAGSDLGAYLRKLIDR
jgi:uncharacterized protein